MSDIPPDVTLPCGCLLRAEVVDGVNTLTAIACRAGCENVAAMLQEADRQDVPVEVQES